MALRTGDRPRTDTIDISGGCCSTIDGSRTDGFAPGNRLLRTRGEETGTGSFDAILDRRAAFTLSLISWHERCGSRSCPGNLGKDKVC